MLIALTGATGFLGRYIANHLLEQDHSIRAWHRPRSDRGGFVSDNIEWIEGRLDDQPSTDALVEGVDVVVHAALERPGRGFTGAEGDLVEFAQRNIVGSLRLMQSAHRAGVKRFVFISSCAVHDVILEDRKLDEAHPLWARSHYGAHKAAIEKFVHSFGLGAPGGWPICALRPTGIYGLARPVEDSRFMPIVRDVMAGKPIDSAAGGKEVHAADVARAVDVLLHTDEKAITGQAFNCYDMYVSTQHVAAIAKRITDSSSTIADRNRGPKHQIETSKLRALGMNFGGESLLERTIAQMVEMTSVQGLSS